MERSFNIDSLGDHPTLFTAKDEGVVFAAGEVVADRFEVVEAVGGGGMGLVYKVRDQLMEGELKALKVILPSLMKSERAQQRFVQEAHIAQKLSHPNIVTTYDLGEHAGIRFLTMEYLDGHSLDEILSERGTLSLDKTLRVMAGVLEALAYAHRTTIHRDIKPQNIFVCRDGAVKLLDFGLARIVGSNRFTQSSAAVGTAVYMAPEQLQGEEATRRADLYSLGVVIYQCLTGRLPLGRFRLPSEFNSSLPRWLDDLLLELLAPSPEERPESAKVVQRLIRQGVREGESTTQEALSGGSGRSRTGNGVAQPREIQEPRQRQPEPPALTAKAAPKRRMFLIIAAVVMLALAVPFILRREGPAPAGPEDNGLAGAASSETSGQQGRAARDDPGQGPASTTAAPAASRQPSQQTERQPTPGDIKTVDLGGGVTLELVWIPPGDFMMGSKLSAEQVASKYDGKAEYYTDEHPRHRVTISKGFWMGKYEVTNAQYRRFKADHSSKEYAGHSLDGDRQPAVYVSWEDAQAFCKWLSERTGEGFTLPTEAQWEYACRAGTDTVRYWGDDDGTMGNYANVYDRTGKAEFNHPWDAADTTDGHKVTAPVGSFRPNAFGLYDMIGNVLEWCQDWYGDYPSGSVTDPTGPSTGSYRVLRGGSWSLNPWYCRSANRFRVVPGYRRSRLGFRLARP